MSINSVVLDADRTPLPINSLEKTKQTFSNMEMEIVTGSGYPGSSNQYFGKGTLTCTNYRLIFVSDPPQPLFDSFMATWNKMEEGEQAKPNIMSKLLSFKAAKYETIVHPLEDEAKLNGPGRLTLSFKASKECVEFSEIVKSCRWTGQLDPENTAEPPPAYPVIPNSPPSYQEALQSMKRQEDSLKEEAEHFDINTVSPNSSL